MLIAHTIPNPLAQIAKSKIQRGRMDNDGLGSAHTR